MCDKIAYDGWLKVYKRQIGHKIFDILGDYNAVAALILNEYSEILMVKQFRASVMRETLEIPAGAMDVEGESGVECLVRELEEEAHLAIKPEELSPIISYKPNLGFSSSEMHIFMARVNKDRVVFKQPEANEDVYEVGWMRCHDLENLILANRVKDVKTIMVYLYLKTHQLI
ncbi:MAG: NUDIX hydrolase [Syntrophomonadaceae bacterium]|nr:NUDIX hydrolase [Syntrophomonadaceae bacterium]